LRPSLKSLSSLTFEAIRGIMWFVTNTRENWLSTLIDLKRPSLTKGWWCDREKTEQRNMSWKSLSLEEIPQRVAVIDRSFRFCVFPCLILSSNSHTCSARDFLYSQELNSQHLALVSVKSRWIEWFPNDHIIRLSFMKDLVACRSRFQLTSSARRSWKAAGQ
jgi:hypothetical protein